MLDKEQQLQYETEKLYDTKIWIDEQLKHIEHNKEQIELKISKLKKETKSYNVELEVNKKMYENSLKNYNKYSEAKIQPYFGRIDFKEEMRDKESFYIGKFGLYDNSNEEEVVIDWRAPVADLYYSGTEGKVSYIAPIGKITGELCLKRKFLFENSKIINIFDDGINEIIVKAGIDGEGNELVDEFLKINLEKNVSSKLKDVVSTIQKEQNSIIRADISKPIIVQGSAGSGKTTVALHRLAYILYRYKNKIKGSDILVIAPNKLFLDYISEILPDLGVESVNQITFEELSKKFLNIENNMYDKDKKLGFILECKDTNLKNLYLTSSKLKGSLIYKILMDRYIRYLEKRDIDIESIKVGKYVLFDKKIIKKLYAKDLVHLPLNKRKNELHRYFTGRLSERLSSIKDDIEMTYYDEINSIKKKLKDGEERRKKIIELYDKRDKEVIKVKDKALDVINDFFDSWKDNDIISLYYNFLTDEKIFQEVSQNKIPERIYKHLKKCALDHHIREIIDSDDLAALMYLKFKIDGNKDFYKHIVIDEAQDYSMFQLEVMRHMSNNNSFTIVGDIGQGIYYYKGIDNWNNVKENIFSNDINYFQITQSYRSTVEIINFANKVLGKQKYNIKPAVPVLRHGKEPEIVETSSDEEFAINLDRIVDEVSGLGKESIAVIGRNNEECLKISKILEASSSYDWSLVKDSDNALELGKMIIPSYMTKGLEFDCAVIYNCNNENYKNNELDKKLLYVVLTRALHLEYIFFSGEVTSILE